MTSSQFLLSQPLVPSPEFFTEFFQSSPGCCACLEPISPSVAELTGAQFSSATAFRHALSANSPQYLQYPGKVPSLSSHSYW